MRALLMDGFGAVTATRLADIPKPSAGPGDLLVRMGASGINPVECKEVAGYLQQIYPRSGPWVVGGDGAGVVEAVGDGVTGFKPGDAVYFLADRSPGSGALAEYARVPVPCVGKTPKSIDHLAASTLPTAGLTAYQSLFRPDMGNLKAGQSVLIHGSSGGVGSFAVAFAHAEGLHVAATCREANAKYVQSLGADTWIDYTKANIVAETKVWRPKGVDVVVDCYSGGERKDFLDAIAPGGRLVVVMTGTMDVDFAALGATAQSRGITLGVMMIDMSRGPADFARFAELIDAGKAKMPELTVFPLDKGTEALVAMEKGGVRGKIVVKIADLKR